MDCDRCREGLSALLDGEASAVEQGALEAHVARCAACRAHAEGLVRLNRMVRVQAADPVPDLSQQLLARFAPAPARGANPPALARARRRWLQAGVALVAVVQVALALPELLVPVEHFERELASWHLALAVGLGVVAWRPRWALAVIPVVATAAVALLATAGLDVWFGHAQLLEEAQHLLKVAALALLWGLARAVSGPQPREVAA